MPCPGMGDGLSLGHNTPSLHHPQHWNSPGNGGASKPVATRLSFPHSPRTEPRAPAAQVESIALFPNSELWGISSGIYLSFMMCGLTSSIHPHPNGQPVIPVSFQWINYLLPIAALSHLFHVRGPQISFRFSVLFSILSCIPLSMAGCLDYSVALCMMHTPIYVIHTCYTYTHVMEYRIMSFIILEGNPSKCFSPSNGSWSFSDSYDYI